MDVVFEVVVGVIEVAGVLELVDRGVCAMQEHALESLLGVQLAGTNDGPSEI